MTPAESLKMHNDSFLSSTEEAPVVELSFFMRSDRFHSLVNLAENQKSTVAQLLRSLIERELEIDESMN